MKPTFRTMGMFTSKMMEVGRIYILSYPERLFSWAYALLCSDGLAFQNKRTLPIGLEYGVNLMLVWTRSIRDDSDITKLRIPEQFRFAEYPTSCSVRGELHHNRSESHARKDSKVLMSFDIKKGVGDA